MFKKANSKNEGSLYKYLWFAFFLIFFEKSERRQTLNTCSVLTVNTWMFITLFFILCFIIKIKNLTAYIILKLRHLTLQNWGNNK